MAYYSSLLRHRLAELLQASGHAFHAQIWVVHCAFPLLRAKSMQVQKTDTRSQGSLDGHCLGKNLFASSKLLVTHSAEHLLPVTEKAACHLSVTKLAQYAPALPQSLSRAFLDFNPALVRFSQDGYFWKAGFVITTLQSISFTS